MMGRSTRGPWACELSHGFGQYWITELATGEFIATISMHAANAAANAQLIVAAPCLLKSIEDLLEGWPLPDTASEYQLVQAGLDPTEARKIANVREAIAKAKGGQ